MKKILLAFMISGIMAQEHEMDDRDHWDDLLESRPERVESMVIWRLTEDLDLSSEQAEKFFPRFREHREEIDKIGKDERQILGGVRLKIRDDKELSKSEVEKAVKKVTELRKKRVDLESKFILGMDDILSPTQMVKLSVFKHRLMNEMKGEMKGRMGKGDKKKHRKKMKRGGRKRRGF